ncbi:MAG: hypothetical protein Q7J16_04980 [Candidatus Cloacimonadales bacterium]|nr:hypothetical protein [Candidatus Cloacimonadales bacterium]
MNIKRKFLLVILLCLSSILLAQYDQKAILLKQANNLIVHRQYEKANQLYEQILAESPVDYSVVELYIWNLLRISKVKIAAEKLELYHSDMPEVTYIRLHASILINQGELKKARDETMDFLSRNQGNIYFYRNFSMIFEQYRQDEIAIEILEMARKAANDENLYTRELAIDYQNVKDYDKAVTEFFKLLQNQPGFVNYALSRLKMILQEDDTVIKYIEKTASSYEDPLVIEVLAMCFAQVGNYEKALENYDRIDPAKLLVFAQTMSVEDKLDIAEQAYRNYIRKINDPASRANAKVKLAEVLIVAGRIDEAKTVLSQVRDDSDITKPQYRYRTRANLDCRLMLAQIAIIRDESKINVLDFMNDAKNYTYNTNDISQIEYQIIRFLMLSGDFAESSTKLKTLLQNEQPETDAFKLGYYYAFQLAMMQHDPAADSLLGEIIINLPDNAETNDALLLAMLQTNLNQEQKDEFLTAYRLKLLFKDETAIEKLLALSEESQNEEFRILAAEWAISANDKEQAVALLSTDFQNPVLSEYAKLKLVDITQDVWLSRDFLQSNPQSVFSPEFRKILEKL